VVQKTGPVNGRMTGAASQHKRTKPIEAMALAAMLPTNLGDWGVATGNRRRLIGRCSLPQRDEDWDFYHRVAGWAFPFGSARESIVKDCRIFQSAVI